MDAADVDRVLAQNGHGNLRLVDNGVVNRRSPALADLPHVRGYHLVPAGASKAGAVALHRRMRGYKRAETFAVGDSREDLECATEVDVFWLVANAIERDPSMREAVRAQANARVTEVGHGPGVYEAVLATLMNTPDAPKLPSAHPSQAPRDSTNKEAPRQQQKAPYLTPPRPR